MRNVDYVDDLLTIRIPTADPKALHTKIVKALNRSMRNYVVAKDDTDDQLALVTLLDALLQHDNPGVN